MPISAVLCKRLIIDHPFEQKKFKKKKRKSNAQWTKLKLLSTEKLMNQMFKKKSRRATAILGTCTCSLT